MAQVRLGEASGRWLLTATVLGSGVAFLDGTVVNVALPAIGRDLGADLAGLQWTITGYALTLAALILLGGSLGDRYGRRRVYLIGVVWFGIASLACALAPNIATLVGARLLQGIGGALMTPGSLAIIQASFAPADRAKAIGTWSGLAGVTTIIGPFVGGWLVDEFSWRWIFLINVPLCAAVVWITLRAVPESRDPSATGRPDTPGAVLGALGLAGLTYALIAAGDRADVVIVAATGLLGVVSLLAFVLVERRRRHPMLPPGIFASKQFTAANLVTLAVYAALSGASLFIAVQLQVGGGWTALQAGAALVPTTIVLLLLSTSAGALATRIGPRLPMTVGPIVCAVGTALLAISIDRNPSYVVDVLPGVLVFSLGLVLIVAPLTATVLAAVDDRHAGAASGVNNAVARTAGLLAIAVLPLAVGLSGDDYADPVAITAGFRTAMLICAGLLAAGGVIAAIGIRRDVLPAPEPVSQDA
ncbi:MAG: DHA2 family efflux MFS transporter permease subunit [Actinomycetes bacterium]|jgi:EmrB/QacA subfamily drug resistance transporter|nr:DHA2 family efflux MFS transporter permease subunit [Sporichthyaceae bacterium]